MPSKRVILAIAERGPLDQPYLANLYEALRTRFDVSIAIPTAFQSRSGTLDNSLHRYRPRPSVKLKGKVISSKLRLKTLALGCVSDLGPEPGTVGYGPIGEVAASILDIDADHVIAVDHPALLACQLAGKRAHLVSLELWHRRTEQLLVRDSCVLSCLTQNWLRYLALFPKGKVPHFIVPNFPRHFDRPLSIINNENFVLAGSAVPGFGLYVITDFLKAFPGKGSLLGWSPSNILEILRNRGLSDETIHQLIIHKEFLPESEFIERISTHRFGFCIYDLREADQHFLTESQGIYPWSALNYITGFPGKLGMCMNAGVPVIASNLPGMSFVGDHGVGVVVNEYSPASIQEAKQAILAGGNDMRRRCLELARQFCFERCIQPFIEYIEQT